MDIDKDIDRLERERRFWDSFASKYDSFIRKNAASSYEKLLIELLNDTNDSSDLLEIATGTGILSIELRSQISKITAIDISPKMIEIAKKKVKENQISNIDFRVGDSYNLEFPDMSFDTVIASNVLHLLYQPDTAISEMKRVVRKKGKIIIPTYCHGENLKTHLISRLMGIVGFKARSRWSINSFEAFIKRNGLHIERFIILKDKMPLIYVVARKNES
ncbi:class I SAM-dependent methyltransferase [Ancylomarina sp. YFZ004]